MNILKIIREIYGMENLKETFKGTKRMWIGLTIAIIIFMIIINIIMWNILRLFPLTQEIKMNNNYPEGVVFGLSDEMPVELVLLHLKKVGGVLER